MVIQQKLAGSAAFGTISDNDNRCAMWQNIILWKTTDPPQVTIAQW